MGVSYCNNNKLCKQDGGYLDCDKCDRNNEQPEGISTSTIHAMTRESNQHKLIFIEIFGKCFPIKEVAQKGDKIILRPWIIEDKEG